MRFKIGDTVCTVSRAEIAWVANYQTGRLPEMLCHFSPRMVPYLGLHAKIRDATTAGKDGVEIYRLNIDKGENGWPGELLRVNQE